MESKNIFKSIEADMKQFKSFGEEWTELEDKGSAAKSRAYAKKLMKALKTYVAVSIKDEALVKPAPVAVTPEPEPIPEPVAVPEPVIEEVVEEDTGHTSWYDKKD